MTKTFTLVAATMTALAAAVLLAGPANAAVTESSRITTIDLPAGAESAPTAMVKFTHADGTVLVITTPTTAGFANLLVEDPASLASVETKVGKRWIAADNYIVKNIAPAPEAYGLTLGCPMTDENGEHRMVRADGTVYWLTSGQTVQPIQVG